MNKANILRLTVAFATLVTVMIASGQGRPGAVKAPQVPRAAPQVQYTVIDLGTDGVGNQITDSIRAEVNYRVLHLRCRPWHLWRFDCARPALPGGDHNGNQRRKRDGKS